jgi:hypothetical protein
MKPWQGSCSGAFLVLLIGGASLFFIVPVGGAMLIGIPPVFDKLTGWTVPAQYRSLKKNTIQNQ